jgi:choline dehydrogenase-like flavoprotein
MVKQPPRDKIDAIIVGAGAAGSLYAAKLAAAGKEVLVLEAGPAWAPADMVSSQIWARRLKWGGAPVEHQGNHHGFGHNVNTGWGLGGSALHHYATWPRMHEDAFTVKSRYGQGIDWPVGYDELRPYYDRIQDEVGIAGDHKAEIWRPEGKPYPMPPHKKFAQAHLLAKGFEKLGLATAPLPVAITSTWYNNRPPCLYDGWCDAGCPILSLANPYAIYLTEAIDRSVTIQANATVTRLLASQKERVDGVEYADLEGKLHTAHADVVILAASAIQNPRLMLNSKSTRHPQGVGNSNGLVGRYFMLDAVALVYGMFAEKTENYMGVSAGQLTNRATYQDEREGKPFGSYQWQIAPSMKPNDIFGIAVTRADLFGPALHDFVRRGSQHLASMVAMIEQLPQYENRITLSPHKDRFGVPLALVEHNIDPGTKALWEHCCSEGKKVMTAAGAKEAWSGPFNAGHLIGGTLMGNDPAGSVTDSLGRSHEIRNLVLSGSGLFPTSGGVSPTLTLHAVALRSIEHMLAHWRDYAA